MIRDSKDLMRFTVSERVNHWAVAVCFILTALSGLAFFHPVFWLFTQFFGGGVWTRILHPYLALLLIFFFAAMFVRFHALNRMTAADWEWLKRAGEAVGGDDRNMPAQGKFNGGQKLLFWALVVCLASMLLSGIVMWRAYFTFPPLPVRFAAVVHAAGGALLAILILGHIYAAIWTPGTIHAMVYGTVTRAWAKQHHAIWYRRIMNG